ncbi:aldo/keto reductase family oxidoreductase [Aeromonas salmonicida subsp. achromogenes]|uniref:aldo/keto reductase n=1 Tax=Aeromonas salmonicida TaxID=645 RepID=UPI000306AB2D|nr:aldo/keto reductase family oxidoreductase [Aeromonas salmonicida]TMX13701.1 aldo/keto reductase family oxidoreductase [Aeromonas salmonicida subsp. achromogenes]TMX17191.1 aldo/keto reductase family oxidoreductase [Aeromonas salmonicida subsp. achromogenes]TMX17938.1 aldo/keto reductase family oxidoreductase [Aeromonas salmonicida subsp. achromogenes]TMX21086.1 aldo/keto reductase family oxidoreductase [Aeromonas salmonicida subsp. achromogenes]
MSVSRLALHAQGPTFSRLIMGYWRLMEWQLSPAALLDLMKYHLDLGVTTIDHADIYGGYQCEEAFGNALRLEPSLRDRMEIVSKCGIALTAKPEHALNHYNTGKAHIIASAEDSLRKLATDHLDLLLIHRPDPLMDADEVADAFISLKQAGKVKHLGVSNFSARQFELLQSRLPFPLVTNQLEISPLNQSTTLDGTLDLCQQLRIKPMAWSCLGGGRLFDGQVYAPLRAELEQIRHEVGAQNIEQLVYAWVMMLPSQPLPLIGSGKRERIAAAVAAESIALTSQQWFRIRKAALGYDVP